VTAADYGAERALADVLGGYGGGWAFWRAALEAVALAVERSREREGAFCHYPAGELRRFGSDLVDALAMLRTAVAVQLAVNADGAGDLQRAESIADALLERVRDAAADRAVT
jgi:hypothetical protein